MPPDQPKPNRSGTETRKKSHPVTVRFGETEFADLDERASAAGVTLPSYIRETILQPEKRKTATRNRPTVDRELAAQIVAQLGRISGNVYQISRAANFGAFESAEWAGVREEVCAAVQVVMQAYGRPT